MKKLVLVAMILAVASMAFAEPRPPGMREAHTTISAGDEIFCAIVGKQSGSVYYPTLTQISCTADCTITVEALDSEGYYSGDDSAMIILGATAYATIDAFAEPVVSLYADEPKWVLYPIKKIVVVTAPTGGTLHVSCHYN